LSIFTDILSQPTAGYVIGTVAGIAGRQLLGAKRWDKIRTTAVSILRNPSQTDDPVSALKEAWADTYADTIKKEAERIRSRARDTTYLIKKP
jgi:hypothetical protein